MATSSARLEQVRMDHLRWISAHLEGKKARAKLVRTTRKCAKLAENHMQANVGMQAKGPRARTKEKENLTKKERIPREIKERKN